MKTDNCMKTPMKLKKCSAANCTAALLVCGLLAAQGAGFDLPDQDAFVIGRGMAFVATADNPSAIYYNPAGITQLQGKNLRVGIYAIDLETTYKPTSGPEAGKSFDNQNRLHALPQFYYTYTPNESPISLGLGVYAPFGLSQKWPQDTGFRTVATQGSINYLTANPIIAIKLAPNFSMGAGLTINYAQLDLRQGLVWPAQPYDELRFRGDGWDVGYNLGAMWQPHEKVSLGVTFRSTTTPTLTGHTTFHNKVAFPPGSEEPFVPAFPTQHVAARTDDPLPLKVIAGISYRPTPKWNFEFDADYTDWKRQDKLTIHQDSGFAGLLPKDINVPLKWESSFYYEFGATRYLENGWLVSGGYIFNENSIPDSHYSPLVTDMDRHFFSLGLGHRGQRFDFDVAYQFGYGPTRTVSGSAPSTTGQTADGKYDFISHAVAVSVGMHF
jgi:long-chain fatty acid transport protein